MKIEVAGQGRFHGWRTILSSDLAKDVTWDDDAGIKSCQSIGWTNIELSLNGEYRAQVTFTDNDLKALVPHLLTKDERIELADLTDEDKISMGNAAMAKLSNGDRSDIKALFGALKAMLPRDEVIAQLKLTDDEKINITRETLRDMTFGEVVARLYDGAEQKAA